MHDGTDVVTEHTSERQMKHGEQLAPLIETALGAAGLVRQDLTAIGVGVGPGPFTGLRVGLVTARTLAFVLELPVYGVCSLDVLAAEARSHRGGRLRVRGRDRRAAQGGLLRDVRRRRPSARPARPSTSPPHSRPTAWSWGRGRASTPTPSRRASGHDRPSAGWLARAVAEELAELRDPEPLYLRRPDAEAAHAPKRVS